jgi:predicted DNA-binding protein
VDVLIRDIPDETVERVQKAADREGRSRNSELKILIETALKKVE